MKTFEELHPELSPSPICGQVNDYENWKLINGRNVLIERWHRDEASGQMILVESEVTDKIEKLKKEMEKLERMINHEKAENQNERL